MSQALKQGDSTIKAGRLRNGDAVIPIWCPTGGKVFSHFPAEYHSMHRLSDVVEISDISAEKINERDLFAVGKTRKTQNDGVKWTMTLTGRGNANEIKGILMGKDFHKYPVVKEGDSKTAAGHFFLLAATEDTSEIQFSTVLLDCEVDLGDIAGATDGESNFSITITCRSDVYSTTSDLIPIRELWFDGTSPADGSTAIVNTAAPDGTNATFKLGSGNNTGLTDTPLAVAAIEAKSGTAQEYILSYKVNETDSTAFTYASTTGIITPSSVLADGAKLEVIYFVRAGARAFDSTKEYGNGEIVSYNSAYYQCDVAGTTGTTPAGSSPWPTYTGFGVIAAGGSGVGTPLVPYNAANKYSLYEDWNDLYKV